ncbi:cell adhesion molecule 3-like isoform X1 [Leuresthes tenuis]|uniref:cell adhesion molecule 3-like isoform X1 n=1 Tax=Leuresthes tenuis TaxID=355514 RepID=UPI003B506C95
MELLSLVCLFVLAWSARTLGDETGPAVIKVTVEEGSDVVLPCVLSSKENLELNLFDWKKDPQKQVFMYDAGCHYNNGRSGQDEQFKGRVSHFPEELRNGNASIMIRNTKVADSGNYTCEFPHLQPERIFHIQLVVGPAVIKVTVEEGSNVVLPCVLSSKENLELKLFDWKKDPRKEVFMYDAGLHYNDGRSGQDEQFEGRVSHFQEELRNGNASIMIRNTKVADSGNYTCDFPHLQPKRIFHIQLVVGACPEPVVTTSKESNAVRLHCEARGASPKPEVQLQDSAGNPVPAENVTVTEKKGYYDTILFGYVTKEDHYRCVVQQKEICHQINSKDIWINPGAASEPSITTLDQTKDWALLQCAVRGASPKPKVFWQDSAGNVLPAKEPEITERGDSYDIILQITVTKTDKYRCVATQEEINHQIHGEDYVHLSEFHSGPTVAAVIFGLLFVGGVILLVLVSKGVINLNCNKDQQGPTSFSSNSMQPSDQDPRQPLND